jgi:glycosyltransferase involved in cell wall biosynthesis
MVTYNQAAFVQQAIDGVLMQRTSFPFELVIADDGSTDGTGGIIDRAAAAYPDRIRVLRSAQNRGKWGNFNYADALAACRGTYAAFLDGDDYWIDPEKLQRQSDFLDAHPECSGVFHRVELVDASGDVLGLYPPASESRTRQFFNDLVEGNAIAWSSAMYRLIAPLPAWPFELFCLDWAIHLIHASRGSIAMLDQVMGAYRRHSGGVWSPLRRIDQIKELMAFTTGLPRHFPEVDRRLIRRAIRRHALEIAMLYRAEGKPFSAVKSTASALASDPFTAASWAEAARRWLGSFRWIREQVRTR